MSTEKTPDVKLTPQQKLFVEAYLSNGWNATKAAISAGYSEKSARTLGCNNLKDANIKAEIDKFFEKNKRDKAQIRENLTSLLVDISTVTIDMFIDRVVKQGKRAGTIQWKDIKDWSPAMKKAVTGFKYDRFGTMTIELSGKQWASDMLAKHITYYSDEEGAGGQKNQVVIMLPDNGRDHK